MITLENIFSVQNLSRATKQVIENKGAPGMDKLTCDDIIPWFKAHPNQLTNAIKEGTYKPLPIKRVYIPKGDGKLRPLGIPSVIDRVVQQAICNSLSEEYDSSFSDSSFGFRPERSTHQTIIRACEILNDGYEYVIDLDLEKFFDTVNHSKILQLLSETIKDGRVISLINKILKAKIIDGKEVIKPKMGLTQGAPCSPVLANILLDQLDKELESRNHKFVRYADDMMIFTKTQRAAERVYESIKRFIEKKLFLKINQEKTRIAHMNPQIKFLGFGFFRSKIGEKYRPIVHKKSKKKLTSKLKELLNKKCPKGTEVTRKIVNTFLMGWTHYFYIGITRTNMEMVEKWIRHKIRAIYIKCWKQNATRYKELIHLGTASPTRCRKVAHSSLGIWAKSAHANYIITKDIIHQEWGWMSIYEILENKLWKCLGY